MTQKRYYIYTQSSLSNFEIQCHRLIFVRNFKQLNVLSTLMVTWYIHHESDGTQGSHERFRSLFRCFVARSSARFRSISFAFSRTHRLFFLFSLLIIVFLFPFREKVPRAPLTFVNLFCSSLMNGRFKVQPVARSQLNGG